MGILQFHSMIKQKILTLSTIQLFILVCCIIMPLTFYSEARAENSLLQESNWFVEMERFSDSAHTGINCEECHGTMTENDSEHPDPEDPGYLKTDPKRNFDYELCEKCHKKTYERYTKGEHAKALKEEMETGDVSETGHAPTCGDCHSAHYAPAHLSRTQIGINMTETCGECHTAQKKSYLKNFHGKTAVYLQNERSAYCTDCHGAHECISLEEETKALNACRRCHPQAQEGFTNVIIHESRVEVEKKSDSKRQSLKIVYVMGSISLIFVVALLTLLYSHSFLLLLRKIHEKLRKH